jgi:hypothetical protein
MPDNSADFARAFGEELSRFLDTRHMSLAEAAREIGLGPEGRARISAYCHDSPRGKRPGYKVTAESINGHRTSLEKPIEQLRIAFDSQLNLTRREGEFFIDVKRPAGRIEVSLILNSSKENRG